MTDSRKKSLLNNCHGQGVVESLLSLPVIVLTLSALLFLSYRAVLFFCADYFLHEAIVCTDANPTSACEAKLQRQISQVLIAGKQLKATLSRNHNNIRGRIEIHFPSVSENFGPPLVIEKQLQIPLKVPKSWPRL